MITAYADASQTNKNMHLGFVVMDSNKNILLQMRKETNAADVLQGEFEALIWLLDTLNQNGINECNVLTDSDCAYNALFGFRKTRASDIANRNRIREFLGLHASIKLGIINTDHNWAHFAARGEDVGNAMKRAFNPFELYDADENIISALREYVNKNNYSDLRMRYWLSEMISKANEVAPSLFGVWNFTVAVNKDSLRVLHIDGEKIKKKQRKAA